METAMNKIQDPIISDQWQDNIIHYHTDNIIMVQYQ